MADKIIQRHDTLENWESENPILAEGELGFVTNTDMYKIGDGESAWNNLRMRGFNGNVASSTGDGEESVMSQKAVTDELNKLQTSIDEEISRATTKENAIETDLQEEITRAKETEQQLNNKINSNSSSISGFESTVKAFNTALEYEVERATNKENSLQTAIDAEKTRAEQAEQTLTDNLNKEITDRITAITNVTNSLNTEISNREKAETNIKNTTSKIVFTSDSNANEFFKEIYIHPWQNNNIKQIAVDRGVTTTNANKWQITFITDDNKYSYVYLGSNASIVESAEYINGVIASTKDGAFGVGATFYAVVDWNKIPNNQTTIFNANLTPLAFNSKFSPIITHVLQSYDIVKGSLGNAFFKELYLENLRQQVWEGSVLKGLHAIPYNEIEKRLSINGIERNVNGEWKINFGVRHDGTVHGFYKIFDQSPENDEVLVADLLAWIGDGSIRYTAKMYAVVDWNLIPDGTTLSYARPLLPHVLDKRFSPIISAYIGNSIKWSSSFNMNDYTTQGVYYISGDRTATTDNLPIQNIGYISGQITVLDANGCITQYLKLTNAGGSEGKEYIRTYTSGSWSAWRELKQTANLGQVTDEQLKEYVDNGYYEGVIFNDYADLNNLTLIIQGFLDTIPTSSGTPNLVSGTLFSMEVLNNYVVATEASNLLGVTVPRSVTQVAKIQLVNNGYYDGTSFFIVQRTKVGDVWSNWKMVNVI